MQSTFNFTDPSWEVNDQTTVIALSGARIDTSGAQWRLSAAEVLNWDLMPLQQGPILISTEAYFRNFIRRSNPRYVYGQFNWLKTCFISTNDVITNINDSAKYDIAFFEVLHTHLREIFSEGAVSNYLDAYRRWYLWCTDAQCEGFDEEIAAELESRTIGGNLKGAAVLRDDPDEGPLRQIEIEALIAHLHRAGETATLDIELLAAAWLFLAFGTNPKNLILLNEEDLLKTKQNDESIIYELRLPRIKKGQVKERKGFKTRALLPEIGQLLEQLIEQNTRARRLALLEHNPIRFAQPLFRREAPKEALLGTDFESDAYRRDNQWFNNALYLIVTTLDLKAATGGPLHLTPRRLRYTFATRLVQEGASPMELAEALDHTDLQQVMVYFNTRSDVVVRLDKALALQLAPVAQAFMGMLIPSESEAPRGNDPASRIKFLDRNDHQLKNIGNCGSFGFCGLSAPIACYTCFKFQAWLDAPHEAVLDWLVADRDAHLARGADPKMTQMHDTTIRAIAQVVLRCQTIRNVEDER
ncbi:tyrosine-type recombinase/integrase [Chromobacterium violaceum]|uniref:tyrosine-type recombinase/integrase n=1 Tax=Chromobacterium violaceum TaxID=536 RepID=UPI001B330A94|nr:tyrosine-type recombinase/integrase [Chromobacterium violaceum]